MYFQVTLAVDTHEQTVATNSLFDLKTDRACSRERFRLLLAINATTFIFMASK